MNWFHNWWQKASRLQRIGYGMLLAGLVGLAVLLVVLTSIDLPSASTRAVQRWPGIVLLAIQLAGATLAITGWFRGSPSPLSRVDLDKAADLVAREVTTQERRQRARLLGTEPGDPITAANPRFIRAEPLARFQKTATVNDGCFDNIGEYFTYNTPQRLVILGGPGSGKTVLALELLLWLLNRRDATVDPAERSSMPVPVRFSLPDWDPAVPLITWLTGELVARFGLRPSTARALIDADLLLPVLDGLDEMDAPEAVPERAIAAIDQLNAQLDGHIGSPMIITCRTDGYRRMRETAGLVVRPAAEITVQPLASDEICDYLDRDYDRLGEWERVTQWDPVLDQLDDPTDRRLLAILRTPWHLTLAVNYHRDGGDLLALLPTTEERYPRPGAHFDTEEYGHNPRHSDDLSDPYSSRVMALLLAAFIPARSRAFADDLYQPDQVMRWCGTIATHLDDRVDIVPDRWWTIAGEERIRHWHKIVVATLAAALGLVTLGLFTLVSTVGSAGRTGNAAGVIIHAASLTTPFKTATIAVMCASLATQLLVLAGFPGLAAWRADQSHVRSASANPRQLLTWAGQRRMAGSLAFALGIWLIPSITCEAMLRTTGPATGLPAGMLAYGLAIGVTCGIVHGLRPVIEVATDPRTPLSNDATALVTIGLGMGLGFGLGAGQAYGPSLGLASGLAGGLACGLAGALAFGLAGHAWLRCTIAVIYTAYQQRLPLRCCHFLHWAYQAGILRVCGRGYQFRTAGLRDWLQQQQAGPYPLVPHRIPVTSAVE